MKKLIILGIVMMTGCAGSPVLSDKASKIQVYKQDSTLIAKCENLGPVSATVSKMMAADEVVDYAKAEVKEQAAQKGADSIAITNIESGDNGVMNKFTVQAVALKCY